MAWRHSASSAIPAPPVLSEPPERPAAVEGDRPLRPAAGRAPSPTGTSIRRVAATVVAFAAALPLYGDLGRARLFKTYVLWGRARRVGVLVAGVALVGIFLALGHYVLAFGTVACLLPVPVGRFADWLAKRRALRHLASLSWPAAPLPSADETLGRMGLDPSRVRDLLAAASRESEVVIAAFDQYNRVASEVGPIPLFEGWHVAPAEFRRRTYPLQLVIFNGAVAIKKSYHDPRRLYNEAMALHALAGVAGVPRIVSLRRDDRVLYQSFLPGENVGSAMARSDAPVTLQHQVDVNYPGSGRWDEVGAQRPERKACLASLRTVMDAASVDALGSLLNDVHRAGVVIRDVKYGNVIMLDGKPHLCDFDGARLYRRNSLRFLVERESDRDRFNYVFGGQLCSETVFRTEIGELADERRDLFRTPVYYGFGYRAGPLGSSAGPAEWRLLRRHLPSLRGKSVLDLGTMNAMRPLEMLRAGARRVVALAPDPLVARYAGVSRRWVEFLDNCSYDLELVEGAAHEVCERDLSGFYLATAFGSLYLAPQEEMARITRALSQSVAYFVVQANESAVGCSSEIRRRASLPFLRALLAENGFARQHVVRFGLADRPLVIATSSRVAASRATSS